KSGGGAVCFLSGAGRIACKDVGLFEASSCPWPPSPTFYKLLEIERFLHDLQVKQVQLDELFALLSAVKDGQISETEAIERLERLSQWVWVAMDPESKLLLALDVGNRTLAMAQRLVHQVVQVLAPGCVPLFLTDGFREYTTALLTHYGQWVHLLRRQATGPAPKPRWMPLPQLLYAQVVKTVRRRRLVRVRYRVVFGTLAAVNHVLAP